MADIRSERTLVALSAAIVELASEQALSTVTVSQIAARAGINRATFYDHFASPGALLASVLSPDLDAVRQRDNDLRDTGATSSEQIFRIALVGVAEHVERFRPIYALALPDPADNVTHHMLVAHFDVSIRHRLTLLTTAAPDLNHAVASRYLAHGLVGAIEAWLEDATITREHLVESMLLSAPPWWHRQHGE